MSVSPGLIIFKLAYQLSPIIFTTPTGGGGIAKNIPGGILPIVAITEAIHAIDSLITGTGDTTDLDNFFANFEPVPGSTVIDNDFGRFAFANQATAANALIANPLVISLLMHCPANEELGYATKIATMLALTAAFKAHNEGGGTYTVMTPSYFYTNCIMIGMRDASAGQSKQIQHTYQIDFVRPLITLDEATSVQSSLMSKLTGGTQMNGQPTWSGAAATTGSTASGSAASTLPSGASALGGGLPS